MQAELSTLCYLEQDGKYLMLHRVVKKNDINRDKWIGVGGHFEQDESPEECLLREVKEETGYTLTSYRFRGIVTFVSGTGVTEYTHLFTADGFEGEPIECNEGVLEWVPKESVESLNLWEGDKIFFRLLNNNGPFFSLKLVYDKDGDLVSAALDGREMKIQGPYIPSADELTEAALFSACMPQTTESTATKEEAVLHKPEMQKSGLRRILWAAALFAAVLIAGAALFWQNTAVQDGSPGEKRAAVSTGLTAAVSRVKNDAAAAAEVLRSVDTEKYTTKELILVNPWHLLPDGYEAELESVEYGHKMDECAAEHLRDMLSDCRDEGGSPLVCSSFRERTKQTMLFENDVRRFMYRGFSEEEAREETAKNVAVPGSSEHEAGLAVDIVYLYRQTLDENQENNETQQWLMEHCREYGFILRYPRDKQEITGITYEPWHYRYVGKEAAEEITSRGICLEEYLGVISGDESFEALDTDEW